MFSIADNLKSVRQRIQKATNSAGRNLSEVALLAVTKTRTASELQNAVENGLFRFGENYLSEALEKQEALNAMLDTDLANTIEWHFIGPIQSNKTRPIASQFSWVQSLDRIKIAQRLNDQRPDELPPLNVCIQININDEETKSGVPLEQLDSMIDSVTALPRLQLRGLMAIPKADQSDEALAESFQQLHTVFLKLKEQHSAVDTLSIGMSSDIESAIENGSTMVRVGTALFGPRKAKH